MPFDGEVPEISVPADRFTLAYRKAFLEFVDRALARREATGRSRNGQPATARD